MANPRHFNNSTHSSGSQGPVRYLDYESLHRPLDMPRHQLRYALIPVGVALVIGILLFVNYYNTVIVGAQNEAAQVEQVINRGVTSDFPQLSSLISLSNDEIKGEFDYADYTIYDNSSSSDTAAGGMDLYKLPSDVTLADAAIAYGTGISNLSSSQAAKYLTGSWRFLTNRSNGVELKLRYADFNATTGASAIANAIANQGFDTATAGEIGTDTVGNTTQSGTATIDGATYYWTVSACALSIVYSNEGLPSTAQYVGVRLATSNA